MYNVDNCVVCLRVWSLTIAIDLCTDWPNFIEKLYFSIVDLFYRYKSDNNMKIITTCNDVLKSW